MKIKDAFEKHSVPVKAYSKPGEFIALRHAMKNYLGRDSGLAAVIRAVVDGSLVPVGYTNRFRGITGYLFRSEDLRKYRPVPGMTVPPEGFLNLRGGGSRFGRSDACDSRPGSTGHSAHHGGVSERLFEAVACRGCSTFRGRLRGDIGPRQAIPSQQWFSCALPERVGHTAACDPNT